MSQENSIKSIDLLIRALSQTKQSTIQGLSAQDLSALRSSIDEDDKSKVANLLEDLAVSLRDDPDNKRQIRTQVNKITDSYGHIKPISDAINSVKLGFLA